MQAGALVLGLTVAATACGTGSQEGDRASGTKREARIVRPTRSVDRLVPVGATGARMHLVCTGSGPSTAVLISGFGDGAESWAGVADGVAGNSRVCTYDRPGLGTSDAPTKTQTFVTEAAQLHQLLVAAGEPGPYVVAGHSFGGVEAVAFAARYPSQVDGLLLVDASPAGWPAAACGVPQDGSATATGFRQVCESISDPSKNPERLDAVPAFAQVGRVDSLGAVPMVVLTRAEVTYPGLGATVNRTLADAWQTGQRHWASLSSGAELVPVAQSGHYIQVDQRDLVIDRLQRLLASES